MRSQVGATPQWEQFKENAAPLERGRDVKKLSHALAIQASSTKQHRQEDDNNIRSFELLVRPSSKFAAKIAENKIQDKDEINNTLSSCKVDKDPIIHWMRYIKYHEETYPSDTHSQFLLKERCTQSLLHHPKYTNDVRYIRVCVLYADKTDDPQEQFKFFHKHKIGSEVAIFWLAWAWVAEKKKDFQFADKIFRKAILKKALPIKTVNERYKQFQRRMSRHWLNANAANPESVYDDEHDEQQSARGALSGLTEEGVRQNHRGRGANVMARRPPSGRNGQMVPSESNQEDSQKLNPNQPSGGFQVFADENDDDGDEGGYDLNQSVIQDDDNVHLPSMVRQQDRKKENNIAAEAWNERGGLHSNLEASEQNDDRRDTHGASSIVSRWAGSGQDSLVAGGTSAQPAFQVFVDEDCAEEVAAKPGKQGTLGGRSLRPRFDEGREPVKSSKSSSSFLERSQSSAKHSRPTNAIPLTKQSKQTTEDRKSKSSKVPLGFDKKLVAKDRHGREKCFEEHRAMARSFKIVPPSANFNLLHKVEEFCSMSIDSCMDMDDASTIEEVEMDEASRSMSMIPESDDEDEARHGTNILNLRSIAYDAEKRASSKKVFGLNTSIGNGNSSISRHNTSTASSTVDERDAVGVYGDREETLNTKFAARELSMMFSSPAGLNQSAVTSTRKVSEKLLFSVRHDDSYTPMDKPALRSARNDGSAFAIFCDDDDGIKEEKPKDSGFNIFNEDEKETKFQGPSIPSSSFGIYYDDSDSDDDSYDREAGNGDTASLTDIMNVMNDISPEKSKPKGDSKLATGGFTIFYDDSSEKELGVDHGSVLTADTAAFGDLSFIPAATDGDTCNLQDEMEGLTLCSKRYK